MRVRAREKAGEPRKQRSQHHEYARPIRLLQIRYGVGKGTQSHAKVCLQLQIRDSTLERRCPRWGGEIGPSWPRAEADLGWHLRSERRR